MKNITSIAITEETKDMRKDPHKEFSALAIKS